MNKQRPKKRAEPKAAEKVAKRGQTEKHDVANKRRNGLELDALKEESATKSASKRGQNQEDGIQRRRGSSGSRAKEGDTAKSAVKPQRKEVSTKNPQDLTTKEASENSVNREKECTEVFEAAKTSPGVKECQNSSVRKGSGDATEIVVCARGISATEKAFILEGEIEGCRSDGRELLEIRPLELSVGVLESRSFGSCRIRNAETDLICAIKPDVVTPSLHTPDAGHISLRAQFSSPAVAQSQLQCSQDSGVAQLQRLTESLLDGPLHETFFPRSALCILPHRFAWHLQIDLMIYTMGGAILDLSSVAIACALRDLKLPFLKITVKSSRRADDFGDDSVAKPGSECLEISRAGEGSDDCNKATFFRLQQTLDFAVDATKSAAPSSIPRVPIITTVAFLKAGNIIADLSQGERAASEILFEGLILPCEPSSPRGGASGSEKAVGGRPRLAGLKKLGGDPVSLAQLASVHPIIEAVGVQIYDAIIRSLRDNKKPSLLQPVSLAPL